MAFTFLPDLPHAGPWAIAERLAWYRWPQWWPGPSPVQPWAQSYQIGQARRGFLAPFDSVLIDNQGDTHPTAPPPTTDPPTGSGYLWEAIPSTYELSPGQLSAVTVEDTPTITVKPAAALAAMLAATDPQPHQLCAVPTRANRPAYWTKARIDPLQPGLFAGGMGNALTTRQALPLLKASTSDPSVWLGTQVPVLFEPLFLNDRPPGDPSGFPADFVWNPTTEQWSGGADIFAEAEYMFEPKFSPIYSAAINPETGLPTGAWTPVKECRRRASDLGGFGDNTFLYWGWLIWPDSWRRMSVRAIIADVPAGWEWVGRLAWRPVPSLKFTARRLNGGGVYAVNGTDGYVPDPAEEYGFGLLAPAWQDARNCLNDGVDTGDWKILASVQTATDGWVDVTPSGPTPGQAIMIVGAWGYYNPDDGYLGITDGGLSWVAYPTAAESPCILPVYLGGAIA